ncbi:MAG: serine/threonine-protein kinase [Gemmatimonadales bacterium]
MSELSPDAVGRLRDLMAKPELPDRYRLVEVVGRGGMGVVWRGYDRVLEREVAIKLLAEHVEGEAWVARMERESRILARLEHPGIVAVHDAGLLPDGRAWYVMRLVRGDRLDDAAGRFGGVGDALRVMDRLAETVAFAHAEGVVHRDLKPANVMLGPFGEVLVLDWGAARGDTSADDRASPASSALAGDTAHGTVIGTPGYMAPEQAAGLPADERSDIYGLGAILRDLLAALPGAPPKPLAAIRDRALAADPAGRYPDVVALRDDLRRYQDGGPVAAYREGPLEVVARLARQYRTPILLVSAYLVMRLAILWFRRI